MKVQFFGVEDLKSKSFLFWSNLLEHGSDLFSGIIYFVAGDGRKFRVAFSCYFGVYVAEIFYFRSRQVFNKRYAVSFRELIDEVYDLLND